MHSDRLPLRAVNRWWRAAIADQGNAEDVRDDDSGLTDGLVLVAIVGFAVAFTQADGWLSWVVAVPIALAVAALLGLASAITMRWVGTQITWWETTTIASVTALPLLLTFVPTVGVFVGGIWWIVAMVLSLRHISYAKLNDLALAVLLALALVVLITVGLAYLVAEAA